MPNDYNSVVLPKISGGNHHPPRNRSFEMQQGKTMRYNSLSSKPTFQMEKTLGSFGGSTFGV